MTTGVAVGAGLRPVVAVALAGFRERRRRPAYVVVLLAAVALGYLAAPAAGSHWTIVSVGGYRGVYNSAYTGTVAALSGALWLTVGGFYVVRAALAHDRASGVREILAGTPLRSAAYLLGTWLGNLLVLSSMAAVLAVTALVMLLARGESSAVSPVALLSPFVLFTLPVLAVTAALAVLWETVPLLRGGLGNIVWFGVSLIGMVVAQGPSAPLGGLGTPVFAASLLDQMTAQGLHATDIAIGFMYLDQAPTPFVWTGIPVTAGLVAERAALVLVALVLAALPALWFGRSNPVRASGGPIRSRLPTDVRVETTTAPVAYPSGTVRFGSTFPRLVGGELRILLWGVSRWWWVIAAGLTGIALVVPARSAVVPLLLASWIWPVLVWSRLGVGGRVDALLGAYPAGLRRVLAEWVAGLVLTVAVGAAPALRMAIAADRDGLAAWAAGAVFIPALALAFGVVSKAPRLFQVIYLGLWWSVLNGIAGLDYLGAVAGGPQPIVVAAGAGALLAGSHATVAIRRARR